MFGSLPRIAIFALALCCVTPRTAPALQANKTAAPKNVIVVTFDGMRWQEFFNGANREFINEKAGKVPDTTATIRRWWRNTPEERREALLPFLWTVMAKKGQIFGDSSQGSMARITNGLWFSYPGYNELLAGFPDERIKSNDKIPNPNRTVLEWLNERPHFRGNVAAFGSWDVLPFILNSARSHLFVNGDGPPVLSPRTPEDIILNDLAAALPSVFPDARLDAGTMQGAFRYLRVYRPRVLYVLLGDTDEWAHARRYDLYLEAAHHADTFLRQLWEYVQATPEYKGNTAIVVATDHGRGSGSEEWTNHGREVPASRRIWMAFMGPDIPPLGIRKDTPTTQSQFAATIAALVGEDYNSAEKKAARPVPLAGAVVPR